MQQFIQKFKRLICKKELYKDRDLKKATQTGNIVLIVGIAIIIAYIIFIYLNFSSGGLWNNEFGDAIGGITAPFVGILAAALVYLSFRQQLKANQMLKEIQIEQSIQANISEIIVKTTEKLDTYKYGKTESARAVAQVEKVFSKNTENNNCQCILNIVPHLALLNERIDAINKTYELIDSEELVKGYKSNLHKKLEILLSSYYPKFYSINNSLGKVPETIINNEETKTLEAFKNNISKLIKYHDEKNV
ncbi:MAG: hypothetical protein PF448_13545 [Bacteroidales bacterium]|nr:hypothetical protein [Bacteroidales bacterium]